MSRVRKTETSMNRRGFFALCLAPLAAPILKVLPPSTRKVLPPSTRVVNIPIFAPPGSPFLFDKVSVTIPISDGLLEDSLRLFDDVRRDRVRQMIEREEKFFLEGG